ncbi:MAG TPA: 3-isopropylmalate dehydrogenase [Bacteroidia bacterium]|jgi:3-isopropylmalate dehydrogenase|nr:3-isopropylmalate dehydrogenase [Bacteroidia bacterium]
MQKKIAVLPGDGIGPEVTREAVKCMQSIAVRFNHQFQFDYGLIGAAAIDACGAPFPDETRRLCQKADAILFGAVGDPKYDNNPDATIRPEQGLLKMRKELGLFANVRPVKSYSSLYQSSPLKPEILKGIDLVVFRELTGGIYFGEKTRTKNNATDLCSYSVSEITRIAVLAFEAALRRNKKLTLVDKANVLETSRLWRETVQGLAPSYPSVQTNYMFVDNAAMQLIMNPRQFDVILTENMFGDILSDEASVLAGSLGMLPSASYGDGVSLFEPIHGSYPQAAGKNIANPLGAIFSAALLLESFGLFVESAFLTKAAEESMACGYVTSDMSPRSAVSTSKAGDWISDFVFSHRMETV